MGTFAIRKRRSTLAIAAFAAMGSAAVSAYETQLSYTAYTAAGSCRGRCEVEQTGPASGAVDCYCDQYCVETDDC